MLRRVAMMSRSFANLCSHPLTGRHLAPPLDKPSARVETAWPGWQEGRPGCRQSRLHAVASAAKVKERFRCSECGEESPQWRGRCPSCSEWNS